MQYKFLRKKLLGQKVCTFNNLWLTWLTKKVVPTSVVWENGDLSISLMILASVKLFNVCQVFVSIDFQNFIMSFSIFSPLLLAICIFSVIFLVMCLVMCYSVFAYLLILLLPCRHFNFVWLNLVIFLFMVKGRGGGFLCKV